VALIVCRCPRVLKHLRTHAADDNCPSGGAACRELEARAWRLRGPSCAAPGHSGKVAGVRRLTCIECQQSSDEEARGWEARRFKSEFGTDWLIFFCPACAQRRFHGEAGSETRPLTGERMAGRLHKWSEITHKKDLVEARLAKQARVAPDERPKRIRSSWSAPDW